MGRAGDARILPLATHSVLNAKDGQLSSLILAPSGGDTGLPAGAEVQEMALHSELAVLSACDTGQGNLTGDGVLGLGRTFLEAGVPTLIISLWLIPDSPTVALMDEFYKGLRAGRSKAQALRAAMLNTMKHIRNRRLGGVYNPGGAGRVSASALCARQRERSCCGGLCSALRDAERRTRLPAARRQALQLQHVDEPSGRGGVQPAGFPGQGYREKTQLQSINKETFNMVFTGPWKGEALQVQGTDIQGTRVVSVGMYTER